MIRLHLRARGVPAFAAGLLVVAALVATAMRFLATRPFFDPVEARTPVLAVGPLLAAMLLGPTLAGADEWLERGVPVPWRLIRTGHLAAAVTITAGLLALAGHGDAALIRNTLGCVGLVAAGAALIGTRLAWLPVLAYVCAVYAAAPPLDGGPAQIWAWPVQPSTAPLAWWPVLAVFTAGTALYVLRGARADGA
ncbi:hypothetical protein [Actinoplanes sp. CA-252034]|uniref:hypothetical protein n=1 Tax=Actinoplanes sp. CA-252034 TaxID=3239906 RepID=UPI003D9A09C0